jgi:ribonuclease BN (tRNA processing enzyme)
MLSPFVTGIRKVLVIGYTGGRYMRIRMGCLAALWSLVCAASTAAGSEPSKAQFVTLGTAGGPLTRVKRSEPANAIVAGDAVYLFDMGDGVQRQLAAANLSVARVRAVFLSHHHIDHTGGLAPFVVTRWLTASREPLPVIGPPGTVSLVKGIAQAYHGAELAPITIGGEPMPPIVSSTQPEDLPAQTPEPVEVYKDGNIRVSSVTNDHYHFEPGSESARLARSYSFRIEAGGRVFVYSGDTGPSVNLEKLARDADVLVSEVIDLKAMAGSIRGGAPAVQNGPLMAHLEQDHLTPVQVGRLAAAAHVKSVVLTHIVPGADGETTTSQYTDPVKEQFRGPVTAAKDLDRF